MFMCKRKLVDSKRINHEADCDLIYQFKILFLLCCKPFSKILPNLFLIKMLLEGKDITMSINIKYSRTTFNYFI